MTEAYNYRSSGITFGAFGREVHTFRENDLAHQLRDVLGEIAYRTGHVTAPGLPLEGAFAVVLGTDPRDGLLVVGFEPESPINEATMGKEAGE